MRNQRESLILALDQGTTSSRSILFDHSGSIVTLSQQEFPQLFPESGWVEHDPFEIWNSQYETALEAIEKAGERSQSIVGIGITNQRETTVVWNRHTGKPVSNAIVWQDRRTSAFCDEIRATHGDSIREKTGLIPDAYFSASKVKWILDNNDGVREAAEKGDICFGTIDSWLIWNFSGEHKTDYSNASRTMLFNIHDLSWDDELLELFDIPRNILPEVVDSSGEIASVKIEGPLRGMTINGVAGDQQAALFGQTCFRAGESKNTYGTGCFTLMNTGAEAVTSKNRLLTTIAWSIEGEVSYAIEGSVFVGGAVVQWLRDGLEIIDSSSEVEALSNSVDDNGDVYFVPAFAGLGTPYWNQDARGMIIGITRGTTRGHIARAAQESIAFQTYELLESIQRDFGAAISELRVDGGATANSSLLQFQSDLLGVPVLVPKTSETTALGAAYLAGLSLGVWSGLDGLKQNHLIQSTFNPDFDHSTAGKLIDRWKEAVSRSKDWANA